MRWYAARIGMTAAAGLLLQEVHPVFGLLAALSIYFELFALQHDVLHGALVLPRWLRDPALVLIGATILSSGHAVRAMHLHHHRHPEADDDLESVALYTGWLGALLRLPRWFFAYRVEAYRRVRAEDRRWILLEQALDLGVAIGGLLVPALRPIVLAYAVLELSMPMWAGRVPHRCPAWLERWARRMLWTGSPVFSSLVHHAAHHAAPKRPVFTLGS